MPFPTVWAHAWHLTDHHSIFSRPSMQQFRILLRWLPAEIQPVHPKGNQSWIFIGRTDAEEETPILWPPDAKNWLIERPWCWKRLKVGGEEDIRGWDGCMASLTRWTWVWVTPGDGDGQGGLVWCSPWGHKESDTTEWLNWTEFICVGAGVVQ